MNNSIRAFTIMEVTVAMLIAALAIGITYTCYTIIAKSYLEYQSHQQEMIAVSQLAQVLTKDMDKASIAIYSADGVILKNTEYDITYNVLPDQILRIASVTDTFKLKTKDLNMYFEGQPLNEPNDGDEQNRFDEISFQIISGNTEIPYHYFKQYSSQQLINRIPDAGH